MVLLPDWVNHLPGLTSDGAMKSSLKKTLPLVVGDQIGAANVRYWPIADIPSCTAHVRFRG
jgi:hypothetical protein